MDRNRVLVERAARHLLPLLDDVVFLGGSAAGLLITDPGAPDLRTTVDVDVIAEISTYNAYENFSQRLRALGFAPDTRPGAPICRWALGESIVDLMPTEPAVLGFSNAWYLPALRHAQWFPLAPGLSIRLIDGPHFLATKLVAFVQRGRGEYWLSQDLEDIVAVMDGRPELEQELSEAEASVRTNVRTELARLESDARFQQALPGFLPPGTEGQQRLPLLRKRWKAFVGSATRTA